MVSTVGGSEKVIASIFVDALHCAGNRSISIYFLPGLSSHDIDDDDDHFSDV